MQLEHYEQIEIKLNFLVEQLVLGLTKIGIYLYFG